MISNFDLIEFTYNDRIYFLLSRMWVQEEWLKSIHDRLNKLIYIERKAESLPFLITLSVKKKSVEKYT